MNSKILRRIATGTLQSCKLAYIAHQSVIAKNLTNARTAISYTLPILMLLMFSNEGRAQSIAACTTAVTVANFGVDGDLYANTPVAGVDDWFLSPTWPGTGIGVIGQGFSHALRRLTHMIACLASASSTPS